MTAMNVWRMSGAICKVHTCHGIAMMMDLRMHYPSVFSREGINTGNKVRKCSSEVCSLVHFYMYVPSQSELIPAVTTLLTFIIIAFFPLNFITNGNILLIHYLNVSKVLFSTSTFKLLSYTELPISPKTYLKLYARIMCIHKSNHGGVT